MLSRVAGRRVTYSELTREAILIACARIAGSGSAFSVCFFACLSALNFACNSERET